MQLLIGIIVAIVVVVGGGAYVAMNPEIIASLTGGAQTEGETEIGSEEGDNASVGNTFASILALGQDVVCTFNRDDGAGDSSSGTFYITAGGSQMRGDFSSTQNGTPTDGHLLRTQGYSYMWSDSAPQGIKTQVVNETELTAEGQSGGIDKHTEFACQAWSVDNSTFTLPEGVVFTDMSAQINAAVEASGSSDAY